MNENLKQSHGYGGVVENSLIETDNGLLYVDELFNVFLSDCSNVYKNEINRFYNNGIKPVFRLELENGLSIMSTVNKEVLILNDETGMEEIISISELSQGDRIKIK